MPPLRRSVTLLVALLVSACLDESRLNTSCQWAGDTTSAALDLAMAADRRHLTNDTRIAGENATRFRDSVKVHFGFAAAGRLDFECLDRLYTTIGTQHRVGRTAIDAAATRRDVLLDIALIYLPVGAVFLFVSLHLCRRRFRRPPPPDEQWTLWVGLVWTGLIASAAAAMAAHLHSWNVDAVRLRDFHMSFRAGYLPLARHPWLGLLAAFMVYVVAACYEYRATFRRQSVKPSPIVSGGQA